MSTIIDEYAKFAYYMTDAICRSCGSEEMYVKRVCALCKQAINFVCDNCGHITDERVHVDCINAEFLLSMK